MEFQHISGQLSRKVNQNSSIFFNEEIDLFKKIAPPSQESNLSGRDPFIRNALDN